MARAAEFAGSNDVLTASPGRVAPQELAGTLAAGDLRLAVGLALSLGCALVWTGAAARGGVRAWAPRALVAPGLLAGAFGSLRLQALNSALAEDYRATVAASWAQPEEQALEQAEAFYSSTYRDRSPVHASAQLAGLVAGSQDAFERADRTRLLGLFVAIAALLVSSTRRPRAEAARVTSS